MNVAMFKHLLNSTNWLKIMSLLILSNPITFLSLLALAISMMHLRLEPERLTSSKYIESNRTFL